MDSYKRPYRGSKIYVRKKDKEDDTLVKLYKQSEFTKEDAASDALDDDDSSNQDIDDFINDSEGIDEEKIPVKKSVQKARKKNTKEMFAINQSSGLSLKYSPPLSSWPS